MSHGRSHIGRDAGFLEPNANRPGRTSTQRPTSPQMMEGGEDE